MVETELNVPYHQQDTDYYCGAASAQMVLASLGLGLLPQDQLYNDNHAHSILEANWYTAPDGLFWTLNTLSGGHPHPIPSNPEETVDWAFLGYHEATSEDAISRKICWTIQHYTIRGSQSTTSTSTTRGRLCRAHPTRPRLRRRRIRPPTDAGPADSAVSPTS
jgi:hypothetical protein